MVGAQTRCRKVQNRRIVDLIRLGLQAVARSDVDLNRETGTSKKPQQSDSNPMVLLVVTDVVGPDRIGIEAQAVVFHLHGAGVGKDGTQSVVAKIAETQQVDVSRRTARHIPPQGK